MKLSEYAKKHNIQYRSAWNRFKAGKIPNAKMFGLRRSKRKTEQIIKLLESTDDGQEEDSEQHSCLFD